MDWGTDALFFQANGRYPTFLIKDGAFKVKGIGPFLYKAGQLPVHRGRADAGLVLKEAEKRLAEGAAVIFYPEGTATRDPELWPMVAKTGVARLALATGAPVIPDRALGHPRHPPLRQQEGEAVPAQDRAYGSLASRLTCRSGRASTPRRKALRAATDAIMGDGDGPRRGPAGGGAARGLLRSQSHRSRTVPGSTPRPARFAAMPSSAVLHRGQAGGDRAVKAAVLGAGSWGTTFAQVLCRRGHAGDDLGAQRGDRRRRSPTRHENPRYLPGIPLPASLTATDDAADGGRRRRPGGASRCPRRRCGPAWRPGRR